MKSPFSYRLLGLCSFLAMTMGMLSDSYEASFGLMPRTLTNLQPFTGALGGVEASPITDSGIAARPFLVQGDTFTDFISAGTRSCANQFNVCADLANNGTAAGAFTVQQCSDQQTTCNSAQTSATTTNFQVLVSSNADFDFICDS